MSSPTKIAKRYIGNDQVGAAQIRLENNLYLRGRNALDSADIDILKVDADNAVQMASFFLTPPAAPVADYEVSNKKYVDDEIGALDFANRNLDNLQGPTLIPAGVTINSLSVSQSLGSEFEFRTANQTTSGSGAIRIRSGSVEGDFASGGVRMLSGSSANAATSNPLLLATGVATVGSGDINGGTSGSTANGTILSGSINSSGVEGNTGNIQALSGNNQGIGTSGFCVVRTGFSSNAAGGRTGNLFLYTGKSQAAVSGDVLLYTGPVNTDTIGGTSFDNSTSTQATGLINLFTGEIANASSAAATGIFNISTGNNAGTGDSGAITISTGTVASGVRGQVQINSGIFDVNADSTMSIISQGNAEMYSNTAGIIIYGETSAELSSKGAVTVGGQSLTLRSGVDSASSANPILIESVDRVGATASGTVTIRSGNSSAEATGNISLSTGNAAENFDSGDISLSTGTVSGTGVRGIINISALHLDMNASKIVNLADPTDPQDAATRAFVLAQLAAGVDFANETYTLAAGDITAQEIVLADKYMPDSIAVNTNRVSLNVIKDAAEDVAEIYDFLVDNTGANTKLIFRGPSATAGAEALEAGQILFIKGVLLA